MTLEKMRSIDKKEISKLRLDQNRYTLSLLDEGVKIGIFSEEEHYKITREILEIFKDVSLRYNNYESTKVSEEMSDSLLNSIYYSIDAYGLSLGEPINFVSELKNGSVKNIYDKGIRLVYACYKETEKYYWNLRKQRLNIQLDTYNYTIDEALREFFAHYAVVYYAHDTIRRMDYPIVFDNTELKGVFYINQYLKNLDIETRFCRLFTESDIDDIMISYGRTFGIDYRRSLLNVFELLLNNSIFSVVSKNNAKNIRISYEQFLKITRLLKGLNLLEISKIIDEAVSIIIDEFNITDKEIQDYITRYKSIITRRILIASENDNLINLVLTEPVSDLEIDGEVFEDGERMSDDKFRFIARSVANCANIEDKINIILENVKSIKDFIDLLEADCLYGNEYLELFKRLGNVELSLLGRCIFCNEVKNEALNLNYIMQCKEFLDREWQIQYANYIKSLDSKRIRLIEKVEI